MKADHKTDDIQKERERIRAIFSGEEAAVGILQSDKEGRCQLVNDRYCEILDRPREQIIGRHLLEFTHAEDQQRNLKLLQKMTSAGDAFVIDKRYVRSNGAIAWVNEIVSVACDPQGQPQSLYGVVLDITRRKAAEDAVRESQSHLRSILDSSADSFYCTDGEGNTTLYNLAFLETLGFESDAEVIGRNIHGIIHHSHPDGSHYRDEECPIYQCAKTGSAREIRSELFFRRDGSSFPVEYSVRPIVRNGVRQGAICTFRDITEELKAADRQDLLIRELNQRVKNLLLNIATLLNAFADVQTNFIGKAVVFTDGRAGTVENVWLDEHQGLLVSIRGHDGKWPISTIKFAQGRLVE